MPRDDVAFVEDRASEDPYELALCVGVGLEVEATDRSARRRKGLVVLDELVIYAEAGHRPPAECL